MIITGLMDGYTGAVAKNPRFRSVKDPNQIFTKKKLEGQHVEMLHVAAFDPNFLLDERFRKFMLEGKVVLDAWFKAAVSRMIGNGGKVTLYQTIQTSERAGDVAMRAYLFALYEKLEELGVAVHLLQYEAMRAPKTESQWSLPYVAVYPVNGRSYKICNDPALLSMHKYRMKRAAKLSVPLARVPVGATHEQLADWYSNLFIPAMKQLGWRDGN
jgi:hypothetical protein